MCDGGTFEESIQHLREIILRSGWAVQVVEPPPGGVGWAYTVGLVLSYGHPELVVVDEDVHRGGALLHELGRRVRDGEVLEAHAPVSIDATRAELVAVHDVHARGGLLTMWHQVHGMDGDETEPVALQVVVPDLVAASGRRAMRTRFDVPYARLPA